MPPSRIPLPNSSEPAPLPEGSATPEEPASAPPLAGKRVLVLRPAHQCRATVQLLEERGANAISFPAIAIEPPPAPELVAEAIGRLSSYDLVVFTSENGVEAFCAALERGAGGMAALADRRVAAVGSGTARALAARGVATAIVPERHVAEALVDAITGELGPRLRGARILLARALEAREVLPEALGSAGASVDVVPVYRTVKAGPERAAELRELFEQRRVEAVLITSASTIDSVCRLLGSDAPRLLEPCCLASIGPVATAAALGHGLRVDVTAETITIAGLVDALERHLRRSSADRTEG